jgi:two-component system, LytTR family, response regulator
MTVSHIRAVLVDDEVLARLSLRQALVSHPQVEIVGECGNADEALQVIGALEPDLVLLDIRMPGMDGFGLLERLEPDTLPLVVFASAFDEHALRAFDAGAIDYILKPIDQERFDRCMTRVTKQWQQIPADIKPRRHTAFLPNTQYLRRLSVMVGERVKVIRVEEIDWIRAIGNYVGLHISGREILHRDTLINVEAALDPAMFVRIHRGTIVNIDRITEVQPLFRGNAEVILRDGTRLLLTRRFRSHAQVAFGLPAQSLSSLRGSRSSQT